MYISGSLKKHLIDVNRENCDYFSISEIHMGKYFFKYDGHLKTTTDRMMDVYKLQKKLIEGLYAQIILTAKENLASSFSAEVTFLATKIKNLNWKIALIALETLQKLLTYSDLTNLASKIKEFYDLITYLTTNLTDLSQIDIEIIFNLFLNNHTYSKEDIIETKRELFNIDETTLTNAELVIYKMGEFVAPEKLGNITSYFQTDYDYDEIITYLLFEANQKNLEFFTNSNSLLKLKKQV